DHAGDVDAARFEVDHEQHEVADETGEREDLDGEEVGRCDHAEVRIEEGLPRHRLAALGRWCKSMISEDALDRVSSKLVTELPSVPRSRVYPRSGFRWRTGRPGRAAKRPCRIVRFA